MTHRPQRPAAEVVVDLDAIAANTAVLRERVGRPLMAVVKADGYGHGLVPAARAVLAGGADYLGVAVLDEALALRAAGITAPLLAWLHGPGTDFAAALAADVEVSVNAEWGLAEVVAAARRDRPPRPAAPVRRHRAVAAEGRPRGTGPALVAAAARAQADGEVEVVGLWSHMVYADAPTHPTIGGAGAGVRGGGRRWPGAPGSPRRGCTWPTRRPRSRCPDTWYDFVRPGVALYGLDPLGGDPPAHGLRPAMTVRAPVALTKRVPAGVGRLLRARLRHRARRPRSPWCRSATPTAFPGPRATAPRCSAAGAQRTIAGRVCMDQFVLDVGDATVRPGDEVVLWGPGDRGEPTAQQWADAVDTIHYELVTRVGGRFSRRYVGSAGAV